MNVLEDWFITTSLTSAFQSVHPHTSSPLSSPWRKSTVWTLNQHYYSRSIQSLRPHPHHRSRAWYVDWKHKKTYSEICPHSWTRRSRNVKTEWEETKYPDKERQICFHSAELLHIANVGLNVINRFSLPHQQRIFTKMALMSQKIWLGWENVFLRKGGSSCAKMKISFIFPLRI